MRSDFTSEEIKKAQHDANRDMLSGAPGSHPVGTGVGAVTGGVIGGVAGGVATGAAMGTVVGPVGTAAGAAVGAVVGAVAGGLAGKTLAEDIDPTVEHGFWRSNYIGRPISFRVRHTKNMRQPTNMAGKQDCVTTIKRSNKVSPY